MVPERAFRRSWVERSLFPSYGYCGEGLPVEGVFLRVSLPSERDFRVRFRPRRPERPSLSSRDRRFSWGAVCPEVADKVPVADLCDEYKLLIPKSLLPARRFQRRWLSLAPKWLSTPSPLPIKADCPRGPRRASSIAETVSLFFVIFRLGIRAILDPDTDRMPKI